MKKINILLKFFLTCLLFTACSHSLEKEFESFEQNNEKVYLNCNAGFGQENAKTASPEVNLENFRFWLYEVDEDFVNKIEAINTSTNRSIDQMSDSEILTEEELSKLDSKDIKVYCDNTKEKIIKELNNQDMFKKKQNEYYSLRNELKNKEKTALFTGTYSEFLTNEILLNHTGRCNFVLLGQTSSLYYISVVKNEKITLGDNDLYFKLKYFYNAQYFDNEDIYFGEEKLVTEEDQKTVKEESPNCIINFEIPEELKGVVKAITVEESEYDLQPLELDDLNLSCYVKKEIEHEKEIVLPDADGNFQYKGSYKNGEHKLNIKFYAGYIDARKYYAAPEEEKSKFPNYEEMSDEQIEEKIKFGVGRDCLFGYLSSMMEIVQISEGLTSKDVVTLSENAKDNIHKFTIVNEDNVNIPENYFSYYNLNDNFYRYNSGNGELEACDFSEWLIKYLKDFRMSLFIHKEGCNFSGFYFINEYGEEVEIDYGNPSYIEENISLFYEDEVKIYMVYIPCEKVKVVKNEKWTEDSDSYDYDINDVVKLEYPGDVEIRYNLQPQYINPEEDPSFGGRPMPYPENPRDMYEHVYNPETGIKLDNDLVNRYYLYIRPFTAQGIGEEVCYSFSRKDYEWEISYVYNGEVQSDKNYYYKDEIITLPEFEHFIEIGLISEPPAGSAYVGYRDLKDNVYQPGDKYRINGDVVFEILNETEEIEKEGMKIELYKADDADIIPIEITQDNENLYIKFMQNYDKYYVHINYNESISKLNLDTDYNENIIIIPLSNYGDRYVPYNPYENSKLEEKVYSDNSIYCSVIKGDQVYDQTVYFSFSIKK